MTKGQYDRAYFFKATFTKYLALLIGVCYMANPLQQEIGMVFHEISHFFETPNSVIGHPESHASEKITHHYHEHGPSADEHEHELIDFIVSLFDNSGEDGEEDSLLSKVKFDKHIKIDVYPLEKMYPTDEKSNFHSSEYGVLNAYSGVLKEPPQMLSI